MWSKLRWLHFETHTGTHLSKFWKLVYQNYQRIVGFFAAWETNWIICLRVNWQYVSIDSVCVFPTNTSLWCHNGNDAVSKSPASWLFTQPFIQAQIKKHQSSSSLAFVWGTHQWPVNSPHKWPVTQKCFHLMTSSWVYRPLLGLPTVTSCLMDVCNHIYYTKSLDSSCPSFNTLMPRQNGHHFADDIFKCIFLDEKFEI